MHLLTIWVKFASLLQVIGHLNDKTEIYRHKKRPFTQP